MTATAANLLLDIPNARTPAPRLCTGGRPRLQDLRDAQARGVKTVINLCPHSEACDYDPQTTVAALGMAYVNIPVAGAADLTEVKARALDTALRNAAEGGVLVHCQSGNRVGALFALKAHYVDGLDAESALQSGRSAGLTALEPAVRQILQA